MNEKTGNKNEKPILSKTNKFFILILAIILSVISAFNIYSEFRRQIMCSKMAIFNVQAPSPDIDSYLMRKLSFENACLERMEQTGFGNYFWAIASFGFLGYAITLFLKNQKQPATKDV